MPAPVAPSRVAAGGEDLMPEPVATFGAPGSATPSEPVATFGAPEGATALPAALAPLRALAQNLRWCWHRPALEVFRSLDGSLWEASGHNPVRMLALIDPQRVAAAA